MFNFDFSDKLKIILDKLSKKDKKTAEIINRKVREVINNDAEGIKRYKNLRHDLSDYKRVHINRSFVLTFKVDLAKNLVIFWDFDHHDNIY